MNKKVLHKSLVASLLALSHTPVFALESGLVLEEIVVTAQKRTENLQDVAASLVAITSDDLHSREITDFVEIAKVIPGLTIRQGVGTDTSIALRGISYDRQSATAESVDVYWNGTVYQPSALFTSMFDIERVEVLRGPQGTLQGKTSLAGAILVNTRKPSFDAVEGHLKTSFTDDGTKIGELGINLPITDTLAVRLASIYNSNEGDNTDNLTNGDEDKVGVRGGRISIAWQPSDSFDATLTAEYVEQSTTQTFQLAGTGEHGTLTLSDQVGLMARSSSAEIENEIANLELNWHDVGNHSITSVTSYYSTDIGTGTDRDLTNATGGNLFQAVDLISDPYAFSQEIRIDRTDNSWWQYTSGIYYAKTSNHVFNLNDTGPVNGAVQIGVDIDLESEEFGYFTHNRIELSDSDELQIGVRYNRIRRGSKVEQSAGKGIPEQFIARINKIAYNDPHQVDDAFTGGIKYLHNFNDDILGYAAFDISYRPGGIGIEPRIINNIDEIVFEEESTKALELGIKSTLLNGRLQLNVAYYYQQIENYQNFFPEIVLNDAKKGVDSVDAGNFITGVTSNADAISQGVELQAIALFSENWKASAAITYNDFNFADGATGPCNTDTRPSDGQLFQTCDLTDQRVSDEPNWAATASTEYNIPVDQGEVFIRGIYTFNGWTQNPGIAGNDGRTGSYGVVDLFTGFRSGDLEWEATFWVKNLLNKVAESEKFSEESYLSVATGYRQVEVIDERAIGASLRYNFDL